MFVETRYNLVLCLHQNCRRALNLDGVKSHLVRNHHLGLLDAQHATEAVSHHLGQSVAEASPFEGPMATAIQAIQGLPIKSGKRCRDCTYVTYTQEGMRKHYSRVHSIAAPDWMSLQECMVQSLSFIGNSGCFPVIVPDDEDQDQLHCVIDLFIENNLTVATPSVQSEQVADHTERFHQMLGWREFWDEHDTADVKLMIRPLSNDNVLPVLRRGALLFIKNAMSLVPSASHTLLQQLMASKG